MPEQVIRIHLRTQTYNSTKTIRVGDSSKSAVIIREALIKNHIPETEVDQYELSDPVRSEGGVVEMILKPKDVHQSLNDKAFFNPLYGDDDNEDEDEDYGEVDKDMHELLSKETELRQAAESRAFKAEQSLAISIQRIKDLEAQLEQNKEKAGNSGDVDKLKKKNARYKIEIEKLKTQIEIKDEIISDMKNELEELRGEEEKPKKQSDAEWELQNYMERASLKPVSK